MNRGAWWGCKQSDMTEHNCTHTHTHTHTHILKLLIGEYSQDVSQENSQTKGTCIQLHRENSQASSTQTLQSKRLFIFES